MTTSKAALEFERSIRDAEALLERYDSENRQTNSNSAEALKRAGLVMAMASWETYVKTRVDEEVSIWLQPVDGSPIGQFVRRRLDNDLKRFFNPNSARTKQLFADYFEIDITEDWRWANFHPPQAREALNSLIAKRGTAAHEANVSNHPSERPDAVKRDELEKAIRFLKGLVAATDKVKLTK